MPGDPPKMMIYAYTDNEFNDEVSNFEAILNPESYALDYKIEYEDSQAAGTSGAELRFKRIAPQKMDFEFLFDRTGAISGYYDEGEGVLNDIDELKSVVLDYDGEIHRTRYLKLSWGTLLFKCCLTNLTVTYKLFKSDGTPLRAVVKCSFDEFKEENLRVAEENTSSPDLTHIRTVNDGDTLPLMCHRIYGDSKYYLEVARVNNLTDFRNLEVGDKVIFPPLEKSTV
ncbi:MAG: hypothetical protein MI922_14040 [Bacteroidales bacterium]|nr:hypothetical protein [Bacteroidales bacterium]